MNILRRLIITILLVLPALALAGQEVTVKWYTIEEAVRLAQANPRPIFVATYTAWCGWCKKLDKDTFSHPIIADILNNKYYPVKFDAESTAPITFQGKTFINDGKLGKTHQLALGLMQGKASYPTVVFLTAKSELITPIPGYRGPKEFEPLLIYFSGTEWQKRSFDDFVKGFTGKVQ